MASEFPSTPVLYYHFPMLSGLNFSCFDVLRRVSAVCPNVVGAKFTDRDMAELKRCTELGMNMLLGFDEILTAGLEAGADGSIGIAQNFIGILEVDIAEKFKAGNI